MTFARKILVLFPALILLILGGCTKAEKGNLFGSIIGAIVGSEIGGNGLGTVIGAVAGGAVGTSIGRDLDKADRIKMQRTYNNSLNNSQNGKTSTWYNPDTKNNGSFTPQEAYQNKKDEYCREFQQTVTIGGKVETAYGTACRQPDGSWKIISQ